MVGVNVFLFKAEITGSPFGDMAVLLVGILNFRHSCLNPVARFRQALGDVFLYDEHSVLAAEAKGVDHGRPDRLPPGFLRYIVQVALRIGVL